VLNPVIIFTANYLFLLLPAIGAVWFLRLSRAQQKEILVIGFSLERGHYFSAG
jgi:hypothetical protein